LGTAWARLALATLALVASSGCADLAVTADLRRENIQLRERSEQQNQQLAAMQATIDGLHGQLAVARGLSAEDRAGIIAPERIVIVRPTGGEDYDGRPGDDGVTVHFRPVDAAGDALKVAGDVRIDLFDLASGGDSVATLAVPAGELGGHWLGTLMTYHYSLKVPWHGSPPVGNEITVVVTFVDYLTKRSMTAQQVVQINPKPD
jgi:hypothetical protein